MLAAGLTSVLPILALGGLVQASPADLHNRNNDKNSGSYKAKCQAFRISNIESVIQREDSIYYPAGAKINITGLQSSLVASDLPSFCSEFQQDNQLESSLVTKELFFLSIFACRACSGVKLQVYTDSSAPEQYANTEVWLPDEYNGRFSGLGNGGFGGGVDYEAVAYNAVYQGFAGSHKL